MALNLEIRDIILHYHSPFLGKQGLPEGRSKPEDLIKENKVHEQALIAGCF